MHLATEMQQTSGWHLFSFNLTRVLQFPFHGSHFMPWPNSSLENIYEDSLASHFIARPSDLQVFVDYVFISPSILRILNHHGQLKFLWLQERTNCHWWIHFVKFDASVFPKLTWPQGTATVPRGPVFLFAIHQ